ncbi:MAG: hypothetical protein KIT73_10580, partial [Burkholderiales bacterium]|nr:hypothetical protein [Burkholderiales bacterium]
MRTIVAAVAAGLLALLSGAAMAASLNVLETDPPSPATLASGENFFVRFALEDPEPTRVQVRALHRGSAVADLFTSTPRPLPAGGGTEVAFIFLRPKNAPVEVDEIVLSVARESQTLTGAPAESFSMPVQLTWSTAPTTAARPE